MKLKQGKIGVLLTQNFISFLDVIEGYNDGELRYRLGLIGTLWTNLNTQQKDYISEQFSNLPQFLRENGIDNEEQIARLNPAMIVTRFHKLIDLMSKFEEEGYF